MSAKQKISGKQKNKQKPLIKSVKSVSADSAVVRSLGLIIAVLAFLLYANTGNHGYTLDDFSTIKENNVVTQGTSAIPTILKTSYRYGYLSVNDGLYRPLSLVMFAIEWQYFPDSPLVSHWINIVFYSLTGFFLFLLLVELLKKYSLVIPFVTTVLFVAHPIHTEIVASIKSRDEIMCFFFMILSFYFFLKKIKTDSFVWLVASALCFFLAMLSKETGITMLVVFPLMMYFFLDMPVPRIIKQSLAFVVVTVIYFIIRSRVLDTPMSLDAVSYIDNSLVAAPDIFSRLATAVKVLGMYFKLLIFPHPLVCDRSFNAIPNVTFTDIGSIASLLIYAAMLVYALIRLPKKEILSFAILFYLITIALFANIFMIIGSVMAERFVYFSSLGFCLAVAVLLAKVFKVEKAASNYSSTAAFFKNNSKLLSVIAIVLALYSFKTIDRNRVWKNNFTLYTNDVTISSASTRMHYYLGRELIKDVAMAETNEQKQKEYLLQGIAELEKSLVITPSYSDAYSQMGIGYSRLGNREKAIECYQNALKYRPDDPISMNNLGAEYFTMGRYKECIEIYKKVINIDPRYFDANMNLGSCYGTMGDHDNAIVWFRKALEIEPHNAQANFFLSMAYKYKGDVANANVYYQKAIALNPALKQE